MTRTKPRTARGTARGREDTRMPDPADRLRAIREHMTRERAKLPAVDNDGHPITPPEQPADPDPEPAGPRQPAPDPSQGARGTTTAPEADHQPVPAALTNRARIAATRADHWRGQPAHNRPDYAA